MSPKIEAVLIAGPTASGKSSLALELARELGGVVVNADSMQVYRDLRILTNRPSEDEERQAEHRLFGEVDGAVNFSTGRFVDAAAEIKGELDCRLVLPIFVGGTGLYFKALTEGLSDIPAVPQAVREAVRSEAGARTASELHANLADRDPETAARLKPSDRQRILRALEVVAATGRSLSAFQHARIPGPFAGSNLARIFLTPDRAELRARIDLRFEDMVRKGALDEVAVLGERGLDPALPVMRAHGVPGLLAHVRGEMSLEQAILRGQADTRAYAKRQFTWARHQMEGWTWASPDNAAEQIRGMIRG